jgi:cytoskeletal protein RodZ
MTVHKEFFEELRTARQQKGISLEDISRTTLIDKKYLEAIEGGNEDVLPAAYVRAFIREYAAAIGLNADDVMKNYARPAAQDATVAAPEEHSAPEPASVSTPVASGARRPWWENRTLLLSIISVAIVCIIAVVLDISRTNRHRGVQEIPFNTAVRESEQRAFPDDTAKTVAQGHTAAGDSLVLSAASTDSVWMELSIDGTPPNDYLFPPNARRQWKAKEKFTITLGNAGGVRFRLNSTEIGTLGKAGSVVRNVELTRRSLTQSRSTEGNP